MRLFSALHLLTKALPLIVGCIAVCLAPGLAQQSTPNETPEWQIKAGGKMAFEVASVKLSKPGAFSPPNFPFDSGGSFANMRTNELPGGRLSADFPLTAYITFAYKLSLTREQMNAMLGRLPRWIASDRFEIRAKAEGNPTKDQMRLMMQSLLAERFQLAVHFETRETPVFALTLVQSGKTGPKLRPHTEGPACDAPALSEIFPAACDVYAMTLDANGRLAGSRNTTIERLASAIPSFGSTDRPVVDRTGLSGKFDFTIRWTPEPTGTPMAGPSSHAGPQQLAVPEGPTFPTALREQLGLKLESAKATIQTLIVDHVERPSEN